MEIDLFAMIFVGKEMIARSKFANIPNAAQSHSCHIILQDHGNTVWFKDIKLRKLD